LRRVVSGRRSRRRLLGLVSEVGCFHPPQHADALNVTSWVNVDKGDPLARR
jgi:hypothetical protein